MITWFDRITLRKIVYVLAAVVLVVSMLLSTALENTYVSFPQVKNLDRTVPYEVKGIVVYVTEDQSKFIRYLRWIEIVAGAVIVVSLVIKIRIGKKI